jgi:hypothetical protein
MSTPNYHWLNAQYHHRRLASINSCIMHSRSIDMRTVSDNYLLQYYLLTRLRNLTPPQFAVRPTFVRVLQESILNLKIYRGK